MIWFTILAISFIFVVAINEAHLKVDRLSTEIKFLQGDIRVQNKINNSLQSALCALLKINTDNIINGSKMEHMDSHD